LGTKELQTPADLPEIAGKIALILRQRLESSDRGLAVAVESGGR